DPATGYNYNSSFVGKVDVSPGKRARPSRLSQMKNPGRTALFGDGHCEIGGNKFMRSPVADADHDRSSKDIRTSGTQGFRHGGKTNIVFADGHVESLTKSYTLEGDPGFVSTSVEGVKCGFISEDNRLYDLE
ncbi:MAG: hypothetical protein FWG05_03415, partial [Kiritimatiellaeota bacterium]|nr:hypothetical protein [Kiritimatiellota bacterium]